MQKRGSLLRAAMLTGALVSAAVSFSSAHAATRVASGSYQGLSWTASNRIVGQTSTGPVATTGNPIYIAPQPRYSGVVGLLIDEGAAGRFVCSGALLSDRQSILTAGHCVSGGAGTPGPVSTTVFFYGGNNPDTNVYGTPRADGVVTRDVKNYYVNPNYTGEVIDQNDIAVLRLSELAPDFATGYDIYTGGDLTGEQLNVAGYGLRSATGGADGTTGPGSGERTGILRQGDNRYDFRLGDSEFEGLFTDVDPATGERFFGTATVDYSYVSDFDNGLLANDASCVLAVAGIGVAPSAKFCNLGLGATEVSTAGGDSGGPEFVDGKIASVTSYGLSFGTTYGDYKDGLNSSWGEFNGFVPTFIHGTFLADAIAGVPEPASWALMVLGFGAVGAMLRRREGVFAAG